MINVMDQLPGLRELWALTLGDPAITIALLDGPVALDHPCFQGANSSLCLRSFRIKQATGACRPMRLTSPA